ncbi:hypothetical protein VCHA36P164_50044 [Vibrio chagasii]|nr:hypothetical protein VCHA36P164_50044 [Vibrio chagasii]
MCGQLGFEQNLSIFADNIHKYSAYHVTKFAPIGDMWKNQCN